MILRYSDSLCNIFAQQDDFKTKAGSRVRYFTLHCIQNEYILWQKVLQILYSKLNTLLHYTILLNMSYIQSSFHMLGYNKIDSICTFCL